MDHSDNSSSLEKVINEGKVEGSPIGSAKLGYFDSDGNQIADNVCVLIVDYKFENDAENIRLGCEKDRENLRETFSIRRNCRFRQLSSPKKKDLLQLLSNDDYLLEYFDSQTAPSVFILFILSHGKRNGVIATDHIDKKSGEYVSFTTVEIVDSLKKLECLKSSLKIVFFAPCRGEILAQSPSSEIPEDRSSCRISNFPNEENFIISYSTVETTKAKRDQKLGTVFVQKACEVLNATREDIPLPVYLTLMQHKIHSAALNFGQTPELKFFPHRNFTISRLEIPLNTTKEHDALGKIRVDPQCTRLNYFPWLSTSGEQNVRGKRAVIICDTLDSNAENLEAILRENLEFETSVASNTNTTLKNLYTYVQGAQSDVGCIAVCYFAKISANDEGEICVLVEGVNRPISEIIYQFVGPLNEKWMGRPKLFFFQNQTAASDILHDKTAGTQFSITSTNHSGLFVQVLPSEDSYGYLIELLNNPELRDGTKSVQEVAVKMLNNYSGRLGNALKPQIMSTMQHLLDFPAWPRTFVKPRFRTYSPFYQDNFKFDDLLRDCKRDYLQTEEFDEYCVRLLVSGAGFGKSVIMREMAEHFKRVQRDKFVIRWVLLDDYDFIDECCPLGAKELLARAGRDFLNLDVEEVIESRKVIIFMDGFDEMCSRLRPKILKLIRDISELRLPLWVASRPQETDLQSLLSNVKTALYDIHPFDQEEQIQLLKILTSKSEEECKQIQGRFTVLENDNILENPQHLTMIADTPNIAESAYSLYHFYERVIEHRVREALKNRECYDETNSRFKSILKDRLQLLQDTAVNYIFRTSPCCTRFDIAFDLNEQKVEKVNNTALASIDLRYKRRFGTTFLHRTFAEFLTARKFLQDISQSGSCRFEMFIELHCQQCRFYVDVFLSDHKNRKEPLSKNLSGYLLESSLRLDRLFWERLTNVFEILERPKLIETAMRLSTMSLASSAWPDIAIKLIEFGVLEATLAGLENSKRKATVMKMLIGAAIERGYNKLFRRYLDEWPDLDEYLNTRDRIFNMDGYAEYMESPLFVASYKKQIEIMRVLIIKGANVNQSFLDLIIKCDREGEAQHSDELFEPIKLLIESGANVNAEIGTQKTTALHWAAKNNHLKTSKYLLEQGAEVNVLSGEGRSVIHEAAQHSKLVAMCQLLVKNGANVNSLTAEGENVLHLAALGAKEENVIFFSDGNQFDLAAKNSSGNTLLHFAAQKTCLVTLKMLAGWAGDEHILDVNDSGENLLHFACFGRNLNVVKYLLSLDQFDVDSRDDKGRTPLLWAVASTEFEFFCQYHDTDVGEISNEKLVQLLLQKGADLLAVDNEQNNAMHWACKSANLTLVHYLLETHQFDLNAKNLAGETPLLIAADCERDLGIVGFLADRGADLNAIDNEGCNVLHRACKRRKPEFAEYLFELGTFDINARNAAGETPMLIAAKYAALDLIWFLRDEKGADMNLVDNLKRNVLHNAAEYNTPEEVAYFIDYDVSLVSVRTESGEYPHQLALKNGREAVSILFSLDIEVLHEYLSESRALEFLDALSRLKASNQQNFGDKFLLHNFFN